MRDTHATRIGDDVTVGHAAILHGCTIHNRVLIGMGSMLLNGAEIAEDSIVAAGTLVPEGKTFPARSLLMGRPAVLKRQLSDADVASIRDYARRYVGYRTDYMPAANGTKAARE
jgi:carbonic anhydrase/acetyltransferase-like protein (isoleucine patch superfamily)